MGLSLGIPQFEMIIIKASGGVGKGLIYTWKDGKEYLGNQLNKTFLATKNSFKKCWYSDFVTGHFFLHFSSIFTNPFRC